MKVMDTVPVVIGGLTSRVGAYIERHALIAPGDTVVVAVSGGADSLCLLYLLHALAPALGCGLHVAHLDHALRPDSAADATFVAARAVALDLPCTTRRQDVASLARQRRLSPEHAGRLARYAFLREVAAAVAAPVDPPRLTPIATGHTRDDQAETLLLNLARGSGLAGAAGMLPGRAGVVRPLLEVTRAETEAYCAAHGLAPREDESNRSPRYARNRLRQEVLPLLEAVQPSARANLAHAARRLAGDLALIERLAASALDRAMTVQPGPQLDRSSAPDDFPSPLAVQLRVEGWAAAEPELRPHMLRLLLRRILGHAEGFGEREYAAMLRALAPAAPSMTLTLPKGLVLTRRGAGAVLGPPSSPVAALGAYRLPIPGLVRTPAGVVRAEYASPPEDWRGLPPHEAYLDRAAAGTELVVRGRRPGDRVRPLGLGGTRKVHDVLIDRKVPWAQRGHIPIVDGPRGIAWVAGLCIGEPYRVLAAGNLAVRLVWEPAGG